MPQRLQSPTVGVQRVDVDLEDRPRHIVGSFRNLDAI
jgi:hypothetical protein